MIHRENYTHINYYDLLEEIEKTNYDKDFDAEFMECYQPGSDCSINICLPNEDEVEGYDWEDWELIMFSVLRENGFSFGDSIYVDIDYA